MESSRTSGLAPRALACAALALGAGCGEYFHPTETARVDGSVDVVARDAPPAAVYHGCVAAMFVDRSDAASDRTVAFGTVGAMASLTFRPKCITIAAGQSVTFMGAFGTHPLSPGTGPATTGEGSPANPIPATNSGASLTVRFPAVGTYPYFCTQHVLVGMAGVVNVRPAD